jgi:hypothetical protein
MCVAAPAATPASAQLRLSDANNVVVVVVVVVAAADDQAEWPRPSSVPCALCTSLGSCFPVATFCVFSMLLFTASQLEECNCVFQSASR